MASSPIQLEPELIPFAARDEREWLQSETVSPADKERLLAELRRRLTVWRANLKPTREQLLQVTHEENRIHAKLDGGNAEFWEALDADWRRKQKPVEWQPEQEWSAKAQEWLDTERRVGRVFNSEKDAGEAYVTSQRPPFAAPSEAQVSRDRIQQMRMVGLRPDPEDVEKVLRDDLEYQRKLAEKIKKVEAGFRLSQPETLADEPTQTEAEIGSKQRQSSVTESPPPADSGTHMPHKVFHSGSLGGSAPEPPKPDHSPANPSQEGIGQKLSRLADSNLFWSGGVGMALVAFGFEWANAPPKFAITLLTIAWLILSVSLYRHRFFERQSQATAALGNVGICLGIALAFTAVWFILRPTTAAEVDALNKQYDEHLRKEAQVQKENAAIDQRIAGREAEIDKNQSAIAQDQKDISAIRKKTTEEATATKPVTPEPMSVAFLYQNKQIQIHNLTKTEFYIWGTKLGDGPVAMEKEPRVVPIEPFHYFLEGFDELALKQIPEGGESKPVYYIFAKDKQGRKFTLRCMLWASVKDHILTVRTQNLGTADGWLE